MRDTPRSLLNDTSSQFSLPETDNKQLKII